MAEIIIAPLAESDLENIWSYISEQNVETASKIIAELMKVMRLLAENPLIGRDKSEFIYNVRSFPHKNYVIFYFPITDGIEVFRVLHGSRNAAELFNDYFEGLNE